MLPNIKAYDVEAHIIARTIDVLINELRAIDDVPARPGDQVIALAMMMRGGADRLAGVLGSRLSANLTRRDHSPMLPNMEPADMQAHYIARTADVLINALRAIPELPARARHRVIALAMTIRDAADGLSNELDHVWLAILERQSIAADGSNVIPFRSPD